MTLLIVYLLLALTISFLCSIMEAVLLSAPMTYLKAKENVPSEVGVRKIIHFKRNIDRPLSAILSLNTIAHTVGAAGVGAQATKVFGEAYFGIVSAVLTLLILILTEIIPKTIGAKYWRNLTNPIGILIGATIFITYPLVILSAFFTRLIANQENEHTTSREEISVLARIGTEEGIFLEKENKIIQNLIKLKSISVAEVMTPRVVVTAADENMALDDFLENKDYLRFSRIPVYTGNGEHVTGYVFRQSVFENLAEDHVGLRLKDIKREILIAPNTRRLFSLWEELLEKKEHIALIVDEYGGMAGIVTMEDIIETLLGFEIVDEKDTIPDMQQYARDRWKSRQDKYRYMERKKDE
jgi:CBS domain containing-hemolysin-like protein